MALKDAPRCTRIKKNGEPCQNPARRGYTVCSSHGAGKLTRRGGRPPTHGRYRNLQHPRLRDLIAEHERDPDPLNVLPELAAARALFQDFIDRYAEWRDALLAWHASFSEQMRPLSPAMAQSLEDVIDELEAHIGPVPETPEVEMEPEPQAHGGWLRRDRVQEEDARIHRSVRAARRLIEALKEEPYLKPREILDVSDAIKHVDVISKVIDREEKARAANAISRPNLFRLMAEMGRVVEHYNTEPDPEKRLQRIKDSWLTIRLP